MRVFRGTKAYACDPLEMVFTGYVHVGQPFRAGATRSLLHLVTRSDLANDFIPNIPDFAVVPSLPSHCGADAHQLDHCHFLMITCLALDMENPGAVTKAHGSESRAPDSEAVDVPGQEMTMALLRSLCRCSRRRGGKNAVGGTRAPSRWRNCVP